MALKWLDNNCFTLTSKLKATDRLLPVSVEDKALLCSELGEDDYTYLTLSSPTSTEVIKVTCFEGDIVIERGMSDTQAATFGAGKCACFKINKEIIDNYLEEAMTGGCTPSVEVAEDSVDFLEVIEPEEGKCNWTIKLNSDFIEKLDEAFGEDACDTCVLSDGVYENATVTVVNGKVCGLNNGTNIVYTGGSCCGCGNCKE